MIMPLTREQAAAAVASAVAQRDTIQANLLELDNSFGNRLLAGAGANLTGETKRRWDAAAAGLAALWETFTAYSAVVDRASGILAGGRRPGSTELTEITTLLTGASVQVTRALPALGRRDLTATGTAELTLTAAVTEMNRAFATASGVAAAAEAVWNEVAGPLQQAESELAEARRQTAGLTDDTLAGALSAAEADLGQLRQVLNCDPLALWQAGQADPARAARLQERVRAVTARAQELAALRQNAESRIAAVTQAVAAAQAAWQDAMAARERAGARIAGVPPAPPPAPADLTGRLPSLEQLKAAGRWQRLAAELDSLARQAADCAEQCRQAERAAGALLDRREELRGMLDAYHARALRLGAAEDTDLGARYDHAHDLLWTAPCDLAAAADAVTGYQQAVRTLSRQGERQ